MTDAEKLKEIQELLERRETSLKVNTYNSTRSGHEVLATRYEVALDEVRAIISDVKRIVK